MVPGEKSSPNQGLLELLSHRSRSYLMTVQVTIPSSQTDDESSIRCKRHCPSPQNEPSRTQNKWHGEAQLLTYLGVESEGFSYLMATHKLDTMNAKKLCDQGVFVVANMIIVVWQHFQQYLYHISKHGREISVAMCLEMAQIHYG